MGEVLLLLAGLLPVGLIAAGLLLYTPDMPRAELEARYAPPPSQFVDVAGVRLHLRDTGPRNARAVILLHGFGASLHTWEGWAEPLSERMRVVRFDIPGFGLTGPDPTGDYSDVRSIAVLDALMDRLGLAQADLVGNSMGGRIAWRFAAQHPDRVRRLVLISPDGFASPEFQYGVAPDVPLTARLLPYTLPAWMLRKTLEPAYGDPSRVTDTQVARYRAMMLVPGVREAILARMGQQVLEPPEPFLRAITAPTLLVWGEKDAMVPLSNAADYQRALRDSRLVTFPTLGHVPFEEAPAETLGAVRDFLER
jgi:pimeloyl-ACP methyl ester carboxylesterase